MVGEDLSSFSLEKLRRRRDQAWELAGLARVDNDVPDMERWTAEARRVAEEIGRRVREGNHDSGERR